MDRLESFVRSADLSRVKSQNLDFGFWILQFPFVLYVVFAFVVYFEPVYVTMLFRDASSRSSHLSFRKSRCYGLRAWRVAHLLAMRRAKKPCVLTSTDGPYKIQVVSRTQKFTLRQFRRALAPVARFANMALQRPQLCWQLQLHPPACLQATASPSRAL